VDGPKGIVTENFTPDSYPWAHPDYAFAHASIVATNRDLFAALCGQSMAETTAEDNLKTMRLVFLALESARSESSVREIKA
jgi:hypothetical protein